MFYTEENCETQTEKKTKIKMLSTLHSCVHAVSSNVLTDKSGYT